MIGSHTRAKVVKNKVAPPFKEGEFDIMYGEGISKEGEILDLGVKAGLVQKSGAWFSYNGERIGQGRENTKKYLRENPAVAEELEAKIRATSADVLLKKAPKGKKGAAAEPAPEPAVKAEPEEKAEKPAPKVDIDVTVD